MASSFDDAPAAHRIGSCAGIRGFAGVSRRGARLRELSAFFYDFHNFFYDFHNSILDSVCQ